MYSKSLAITQSKVEISQSDGGEFSQLIHIFSLIG
jgi:hypothetical protein